MGIMEAEKAWQRLGVQMLCLESRAQREKGARSRLAVQWTGSRVALTIFWGIDLPQLTAYMS